MNKHRISTNIGKDQFVNVELKQDFDLLEILSLRFTQKDIYTSYCADYGVVCGRVSVNNGLGVKNARVSIFIPLTDDDENDPVISTLYPYKSVTDKNEDNYRYNLLPARKQHGGHEPTGTFPDQTDVLNREEVLEVYEKYYKYTVKTNDAGDFMIWGVPIGSQTLHIDVDLSDIGEYSLRPYDFMRMGSGVDDFKNTYSFKASEDLDSLPQIVSFDKTIEVYPFWGSKDLCEIAITRSDFDLADRGITIEPKAFLIGGTYTDTGKNSINKNCQTRDKVGRKCDLTTKSGTIESIRFTTPKDDNNRPVLETYALNEDIPEDGSFILPVPMNMDYVFTNEFGEKEYTNDPDKGIPTSACYRFRFNLDDSGNSRVRKTASYLIPNIREYQSSTTEIEKSYAFSTDWDDYPTEAVSYDADKGILYNEYGEYYPRDYFYRLTYNKVYTISSFQNINYKNDEFRKDKFLGIKELVPNEEDDCASNVVTPPVNFGVKNYTFQLLIADILLFLEHLINVVTLTFFNTVVRVFHALADAVHFWPIKKLSDAIKKFAYRIQNASQKRLYLINYPECEECNTIEYGLDSGIAEASQYCAVGTVDIFGSDDQSDFNRQASGFTFYTAPISGSCSGATYPADLNDFLANQENYYLTYSIHSIELQASGSTENTFTASGLTYLDNDGVFTDAIWYTATIRDKNVLSQEIQSGNTYAEEGCQLYDVPYDESIVRYYYVDNGGGIVQQTGITQGDNVVYTELSDDTEWRLVTDFKGDNYSPITTSGWTEFQDGYFSIVPGSMHNTRLYNILKEYRRRKRVGKMFCGGIVNYSFIDNWLSGSVYFFQFKAKKGKYCEDVVKYIETDDKYYYRSAIYNSETDWGITSGQTNQSSKLIGRPTTLVDLGPRDEFINEICTDPKLDPNCSVARNIGPSSYQNFGEIMGLAINYRMDVAGADYDINDFFDNGGFAFSTDVLNGDIMQLISINNEVGIEEFDLQNARYMGYSYQYLDPEIYPEVFQQVSGSYGPTPITFYLDEEGERVRTCLNMPTHIANDGLTTVSGSLTEASQKIPFFLWDKKDSGFGSLRNQSWDYATSSLQPLQGMTYAYNLTSSLDNSAHKYLLMPMTNNFTGLTVNSITGVTDIIEFDVVSLTDNHTDYDAEYPGFTFLYVTGGTVDVPTDGILYSRYGNAGTWDSNTWNENSDFYILKTQDYYSGDKQILSTPFMFYFGLKTGNTAIDKFIKLFGPKGAFPNAE